MKVNIGREINLQELLEKVVQFLRDSGLPTSKIVLTVEYPEMWQVEGPDIVLKEKLTGIDCETKYENILKELKDRIQ